MKKSKTLLIVIVAFLLFVAVMFFLARSNDTDKYKSTQTIEVKAEQPPYWTPAENKDKG